MVSFEQNNNSGAERRRSQAEKKGKLSISHWKGELHAHSQTSISEPKRPEDVIEGRRGSNCGSIPLEILADYHGAEMRNQYLAITEHSRDADPQKATAGITEWFLNMRMNDTEWLQKNIDKDEVENDIDKDKIRELVQGDVAKVARYDDERLSDILDDIEDFNGNKNRIKLIKGVEVNLLPDGSFDTEMIEEGRFELVNCSIHPDLDPEGFSEIINNREEYQKLLLQGIENPKTNIISHIGHGIDNGLVEQLDWELIARSAMENKVAIEINLKELMTFIYGELMDYERFPKSSAEWRGYLQDKLRKLIPLLPSGIVGEVLKKYFPQGLMIAINTDEHKNKFIDHETTSEGTAASFKERDKRFWIALKITEKYFNQLFDQLGIGSENILNTYSMENLEEFLHKK